MITKKQILTEASKVKILVDKLGLDQSVAERINAICGSLSVWLANKLLIAVAENIYNGNLDTPDIKAKSIEFMNKRISTYSSVLTNIMDYIRVGLNSDISTVKDFSYSKLNDIANKWHEELHIGNDALNYKEEHPIIRDYRKDGIGFYWVDLETHYCDEESERMGHCGRTGGNTLFSLRQYKPLSNGHTLNSSHITAAIGRDGRILQMKGQKNSKPKEVYYPYILDLLMTNEDITGFGYEYDSENDFKITDLTEDQIKALYAKRPDLFDSRSGRRVLVKIGIIERNPDEGNFVLKISPDDVYRYVDGGWNVSSVKTHNGGIRTIDVFEALLTDAWTLFDSNYHDDIGSALQYYVDDKNLSTIKDLLIKMAKNAEYEIDPDEDTEELINELDGDYEISNAINSSVSDGETDSYIDYYQKLLKDALETYGTVTEMNDEGVTITGNIDALFHQQDIDESQSDDYFERCGEKDLACVIIEMLEDIDKPKFSPDDRWTPDVNEEAFNENLADRLSEINVPEPTQIPEPASLDEAINKIKSFYKRII